jgi:hypothetical protein
MKICSRCGTLKDVSEFYPCKHLKSGLRSDCKRCISTNSKQRWANGGKDKRDYDKAKDQALRRKYGITREVYCKMFNEQCGVCAICKKPNLSIDSRSGEPRDLSVDHDHNSGKIRKLLCMNCNRGLGYLKDDPELLRMASEYIESHR